MGKDIFISYSRKDTAVADRICEALDKAGISYFIDRKGIAGGMEFPEILAQAIVDCKIFLFLASRNSYQSNYTSNEITFAFNRKRKMLPYIIDRSELPLALEFTFSCINWRTIEEHPIETVLVNDLKALLGYPASSATEKTSFSVILKSAGHAKLGVVKCVKELTGLGLKDSKELVDNAPSTISRGLSKAEAEIIATTLKKAGAVVEIKKTLPGNSVSASQKTSFSVILKSAGHAKLGVVKCVKELTGLGLKDSKELVDNAPSTVRRGLSKAEAEIIATTLKKAGAVVEIKKTLPGNSVSASQKTSFTVILKSAGHAKLGVIKCVKELTGLGLKDSKELVDNAPSTIRRGLSKSEAEIIATTLKKAGAEVIII